VPKFRSAILADLVMRGLAMIFRTLARVASADFFFVFFRAMQPPCHRVEAETVSFRTLAKYFANWRWALASELRKMLDQAERMRKNNR
jgi:hypothetical protein